MDALGALAADETRPAVWVGEIAEDAITANDEVTVKITDYDANQQFGPVKFVPQPLSGGGVLLPSRGDWCLVALDQDDNAQLVAWRADDPTGGPITVEEGPLSLVDPRTQGRLDVAVTMLPESQPGRRTGKITVPPGLFAYVDQAVILDDVSGVTIEGMGGMSDNVGRPTLVWRGQAGSGPMIRAASAGGVNLVNIALVYDDPSYDGDLIKFGWSARHVDCFLPEVHGCYIGGIQGAHSARSLVNLDRVVGATIDRTQFISSQVAVWGVDGSYSNGVTIGRGTNFDWIDAACVRSPGEAWVIQEAQFGPSFDGAPRGILSAGVIALGLTIQGCWFGDVINTTSPVGFWMDLRGRGVNIIGNRIAVEVAGVPHVAIVFRQVVGGQIVGNRFTAGGGLAVNNDPKAINFVTGSGNSDGVGVEKNQFTNIRTDFDETGLTSGEYHNNAGLADKVINRPATLPAYTVATRPSATTYPGAVIYVSDGGAGAVVQASNGSSWVNLG
jgi:hypothetical protein